MPEESGDKAGKAKAPRLSRRAMVEGDGGEIEMPPLECGEHLIEYLYDVGPAMPAGMSFGAITATEVRAWQAGRGFVLAPWEFRMLRQLSAAYVSELHGAAAPDRPPPFPSVAWRRARARRSDRNLDRFLK